jgi:hypothetical protein
MKMTLPPTAKFSLEVLLRLRLEPASNGRGSAAGSLPHPSAAADPLYAWLALQLGFWTPGGPGARGAEVNGGRSDEDLTTS